LLINNSFFDKVRKSVFLKDSLIYSGTNVLVQLLTVIRGFAVRRILPPEIMGVWNFMMVVQNFLGTLDLGTVSGAARELPILGAKGDFGEKLRVYSASLWFTLIQNSIVSLFAVWYIYWHRGQYPDAEIIAACVGIVIFLISSFYTVYSAFFLTAQQFIRFSQISLVCAIFDTVGFVLSSYLWGLAGLLSISIVSVVLKSGVLIFSGKFVGLRVRMQLPLDTLKRLLSFGFFLRVVDYPYALFSMAAILWITRFMSVEALAFFSMASGFAMQVADMSARAGTVYTMRFLGQIGSGTPRDVIGKQMKQYLLVQLLVILPFLSWAAFIALTFITNTIIPKYSTANEPFLILLLGGFFYVLNSGLTNPWMAEKKLMQRGMANLFGLFVMAGAIAIQWFVLHRQSISDVAYASVLGSYLYFVYMVVAVGKSYWGLSESFKVILSVTIAAAWTFCVLSTGFVFIGKGSQGFMANIKIMLQVGSLTLIAITPLLFYGVKISRIRGGWLK
jgi:O-antigen/teichoic acid export membrane protein